MKIEVDLTHAEALALLRVLRRIDWTDALAGDDQLDAQSLAVSFCEASDKLRAALVAVMDEA